ncbi:MAG TPA: UPF0182 family protein [Jiangellaceae bacterium]|nr:UPF0182 family protein [Jiangellaceae bacterium]
MSQDLPRPAQPFRNRSGTRKRSRALVPTLIVLAVLAVIYGIATALWTERLWFSSVDFVSVFTTKLVTEALLFVVFAVLMAAAISVNAIVAHRLRPRYRPMSAEQQSLDRYRDAIDPIRRWVVIVASILLGLMAGGSAAGQWETFLLWRNGRGFGTADEEFGLDIGWFAFDYPWWRYVLSFGFAAVILGLITAAVTHYVYGGIRLQTAGERVSRAAQAHLSVLIGLFVLLKAVAYWLDRYALVLEDGALLTGGSYTDINAMLPAKTILVFVALICALLFFVNVWRRSWTLPAIGLGLLVLCAVLLGGVWPLIVQQFQVKPSEADREEPYIARNIEATREAYDVEGVQVNQYAATTTVSAGQLAEDSATVPGIRLLDPNVVPPAFQQLQQVRGFYTFPNPLDVDRYEIDDENRDVVVAVREIEVAGIPDAQQNWINEHTVYTHGFGFVAAYGNTRNSDGSPVWAEEDIPPVGELGEYRPRVYFGEFSPEYSIVGAPEGRNPVEFDIPEDPDAGGEQRNYTYTGDGGVPIGSFINKILYATKFQQGNILLSDRVNSSSRILYDRHPRNRVEKVAPWLTVDSNPYPAIVDGNLVWILDGYTTIDSYPYSQRVSLGEATRDSRTALQAVAAQPQDHLNYVRNSVKAVVDAYDGSVTLYAWDETDPVLEAWQEAFPDTVEPRSEISEDLMAHLRYPEDLFKLQRGLLAEYHVTKPTTFYGGQQAWNVPNDPTVSQAVFQPPYYQTIKLPETDTANFSLTTTYVPKGRQNLAAFMAVNADARSDDYGQLTILQLQSETQIDGPAQVANNFEANPAVAQELSLLRQGDADTVTGNLLTLPVGGGLLYVQPVYVQRASGEAAFPLLQKVLVSFGSQIGYADTLQEALDQIFQGESGAETGEEPGTGTPTAPPTGAPTPAPTAPPAGEGAGDLQAAIEDAQQAYDDAQAAQREGDWAAYGAALDRLEEALARAATLSGESPATEPTPTSTP